MIGYDQHAHLIYVRIPANAAPSFSMIKDYIDESIDFWLDLKLK